MRRWLALATLPWLAPAAGQAACTVSASGVSFGVDVPTTPANSTGTVTPNCDSGAYQISLSAGTSAGATQTGRLLTGPGGAEIAYSLSTDSGHTMNWGNNVPGGTGNGTAQPVTVYGRIVAGQYVAPGSYSDSITATVTGTTTVTANFTVNVTVQATCLISANPLAFGTYAGLLLSSSTTLTALCTNQTSWTISLDAGTSPGATVTNRLMVGTGGAELRYSLSSDAGHTVNWASATVPGSGTGTNQSVRVYGQIPAGQFVTPGSYSDTITVTLTY
jgi:spore coat protein U-like protein